MLKFKLYYLMGTISKALKFHSIFKTLLIKIFFNVEDQHILIQNTTAA
jgi:hypothetical protein